VICALDAASQWALTEHTAAEEGLMYLSGDIPALGSKGPKFKGRYRGEK